MTYLDIIANFTEDNLPTLDEVVMGALELFEKKNPPKLDLSEFKKPLIAGSGAAIITAKNIFSNTNALFCDETKFDDYINKDIDGVIICSASGEKHAIGFANKSKDKGLKTKLLTCNPNSTAGNILGKENTIVTEKNREPYTYNTSTYMGWMLAVTGEEPAKIRNFIIDEIDKKLSSINFSNYNAFLLVVPEEFAGINEMFVRKFFEIFGRMLARDVFSYEQVMHALTVVPNQKELAISFGKGEFYYVGDSINFPLPKDCNLASMMAIGYYVIGKIQKSHPPYYQRYIKQYIDGISKTGFGAGLKVIVE